MPLLITPAADLVICQSQPGQRTSLVLGRPISSFVQAFHSLRMPCHVLAVDPVVCKSSSLTPPPHVVVEACHCHEVAAFVRLQAMVRVPLGVTGSTLRN